jgi:lipoprotein-releasing system permease protein
VTGVRLKVDDLFQAPRIARELVKYIDADAYLHDWTKSHANFFRAVQIEKNMMFIILSLIVAVAAFNLVSTLVMAVTDKQADIAILRTLGRGRCRSWQSLSCRARWSASSASGWVSSGAWRWPSISTWWCPSSSACSACISCRRGLLHLRPAIRPAVGRCLGVTLIAFVLALLATLYPSWRASRVNPAEALRYE